MKNPNIFGYFAKSTATITVMLLLLIGAALGAPASTSASLIDFFATSGQDPSPTTVSLGEVNNNFDNIGGNAIITTTITGDNAVAAERSASMDSSFALAQAGISTSNIGNSVESMNYSGVIYSGAMDKKIAIGQNNTGRSNFDGRFKHMTNAATRGFTITSIAISNGYGGGEQASSSFL